MLAVIGGTGMSGLAERTGTSPERVDTSAGRVWVYRASWLGQQVAFVPRHGVGHTLAPHEINHRANILALQALGAARVIATNAVGSLRANLPPGSLVLVGDFIDFTRRRPVTLFEGADGPVRHLDMTEPYCSGLRAAMRASAEDAGIPLVDGGVYVCTDGPRYETPAEVRMLALWGGDVVGMTGLPEAVFAREAGLCYAAIALVTNLGTGLGAPPDHLGIARASAARQEDIQRLTAGAAARLDEQMGCGCATRGL